MANFAGSEFPRELIFMFQQIPLTDLPLYRQVASEFSRVQLNEIAHEGETYEHESIATGEMEKVTILPGNVAIQVNCHRDTFPSHDLSLFSQRIAEVKQSSSQK